MTPGKKEKLYHLKMVKKLLNVILKRLETTSTGWKAHFSGDLICIEYESSSYFMSYREVNTESGDMFGRRTELFKSPDIFKLLTFIAVSETLYNGYLLKEYIMDPHMLVPVKNKNIVVKKD